MNRPLKCQINKNHPTKSTVFCVLLLKGWSSYPTVLAWGSPEASFPFPAEPGSPVLVGEKNQGSAHDADPEPQLRVLVCRDGSSVETRLLGLCLGVSVHPEAVLKPPWLSCWCTSLPSEDDACLKPPTVPAGSNNPPLQSLDPRLLYLQTSVWTVKIAM